MCKKNFNFKFSGHIGFRGKIGAILISGRVGSGQKKTKFFGSGRVGAQSKNYRVGTGQKNCPEAHLYDEVAEKTIEIQFCPTDQMIADVLTKPIPKTQFQNLHASMGVHDIQNTHT